MFSAGHYWKPESWSWTQLDTVGKVSGSLVGSSSSFLIVPRSTNLPLQISFSVNCLFAIGVMLGLGPWTLAMTPKDPKRPILDRAR